MTPQPKKTDASRHLLVVDDDRLVLAALAEGLRGAGYRVTGTASGEDGIRLAIGNAGRLPEGFNLARVPGGVSGLGLVRALLPRRSASLAIAQQGERVVASVALDPPSITRLDPA